MQAIYPGTFDPITKGHIDIIKRAILISDHLVIGIADNAEKQPLLDGITRKKLVISSLEEAKIDSSKIIVKNFSSLLVNFAKENSCNVIIRGIRAVSDFEYEFQMSCMNSKLNNNIQTIFLPASDNAQFISSRFVKRIAKLGGDVSHLVEPSVFKVLKQKYS